MKGAFFEEPHIVKIRDDLEKPKIKNDEVLVKVKYCGICGSDLESYETGALGLAGIIFGHEFSGDIVEIGDKVKKMKIGSRVTANPNIPCLKCYWCKNNQENLCKGLKGLGTTVNGAMAEYINVKASQIHLLPDNLSYEEGALIEPLSVAIYAVRKSGFRLGQNAVVIGAGSIGLCTIQILCAAGASNIIVIEPLESKQDLALKLGANNVLTPENWLNVNKLTKKLGADHIFDCVSLPETFMNAMKYVIKGGTITIIGIHVEPFELKGLLQLILKNIKIQGVYAYDNVEFKTAIRLLEQKKVNVNPMITKRIKLDEVPNAFKNLSKPKHNDIKILVEI